MAASTGELSPTLPTRTILATTLATTTFGVPALTTVLSVPSSCLADYWLDFSYTDVLDSSTFYSVSTEEIFHLGPVDWDNSCFPSGYTPRTFESAFYSPGLCPQSYIQACSTTVTAGTVTETQATCCPSGYLCQTATDWPWYSTNQCVSTIFATSKFLLTSSTDGTIHSDTTTVSSVELNAYGISIRYQPTDFVSASTTTTFPSSSPPSLLVPATFAPSNTTSSTPEADHSSGLSSGGGAGIGVGVTIIVFALIGAGLSYFFRNRRSPPITYEAASVTPMSPTPPAPVPPSDSYDRSELIGSQIYTEHELDQISRKENLSPAIVSPVQHLSHSESVQLGSDKG